MVNLSMYKKKNRKDKGLLPKLQKRNEYLEDLSKLSLPQLHETNERQQKLLANRNRVSLLPDKGAKILEFKKCIEAEIASRNEIEKAAELFSALNIISNDRKTIDNLEWNPKSNSNPESVESSGNTSDIKNSSPEKSPNDSRNSNSTGDNRTREGSTLAESIEPHALFMCSIEDKKPQKVVQFMPYKTTKTDVHDPNKEILRKVKTNWESTSATPPILKNPGVKQLSLQESIALQFEQRKKMKEIEEKRAAERLAASLGADHGDKGLHPDVTSKPNFHHYRIKDRTEEDDDDLYETADEHSDSDDSIGNSTLGNISFAF